MQAGWHDFDPTSPIPHTAILEIEMEEPKIMQIGSYVPNSKCSGKIVETGGIAPTVMENHGMGTAIIEPMSCAIRGRNPENPSDRTSGINTEQRLELGGDVANCLTSVQKDSMVCEPCILGYTRDDKGIVQSYHEKTIAGTLHTSSGCGGNTDQYIKEPIKIRQATAQGYIECPVGGIFDAAYPNSNLRRGRVQQNGDVVGALTSSTDNHCVYEGMQVCRCDNAALVQYRIRKLTEKECFRLMDVDDADIDKIDAHRIKTTLKNSTVKEKPIPKSQKYKMAGNSIAVSCLYHIFYQMFIAESPKPKPIQKSLFD